MTAKKFNPKRVGLRHFAAILGSSVVLLAGCSNMETTAIGGNSGFGTDAVTMSGKVLGGNQPVQFATVQLYTVAQNGYGAAGTLLATTSTGTGGGFGFNKQPSGTFSNLGNTYACPTTGSDALLYVKVTGGNTQGNGSTTVNNSAAVFLAPIGFCSKVSASTFVNISEVTTAATVAAVGQFINPATEQIGSNGTSAGSIAIANAFATVNNLVSQSSGLANTTLTVAPGTGGLNASNVVMTATPESAKLNTIANILSSCVNQVSYSSTGTSACNTLFANAIPPTAAQQTRSAIYYTPGGTTYPAATDTLQAALYMFVNPTDGSQAARTALFNLSPAAGAPYQPTITTLPTDWSLAIAYSTNSVCGTTSSKFFANPYSMGVDGLGNIWITNAPAAGGGPLVEIANNGAPMGCVTSNPVKGLAGGQIDIANNVWFTDSVNNAVYRYTPPTSTDITSNNQVNSVRMYNSPGPVQALTTDGSGTVYFTCTVNGVGEVLQIANGATSDFINAPTLISNTVGGSPSSIFPDTTGDLFVTSGSSYVTELSAATGGVNYIGGYSSVPINGIPSPTYGVVVGPQNRVYITSQDPAASLTVLAPNTGSTTYSIQAGFPTASNTGGLSNPAGIFTDGGQNSFVANNTVESTNNLYGLSEVAIDGTAVSQSGNTNGAYQKSNVYFNKMRNVVTDSSGNVWVTNDNNPSSITEVVGIGTPIYTPYSTGLQKKNGSFQSLP